MDARSASDAEIHQDTLLMKHSRTHRINTWIILETARWLLVGVQYRGPIHRCYRSSSRQKSASCSTLLLCAALQPGFRRKKKEIVSRIFEANLILKRNPTAKPSRFGTIVWPKLFIYILASDAINELSYAGRKSKRVGNELSLTQLRVPSKIRCKSPTGGHSTGRVTHCVAMCIRCS